MPSELAGLLDWLAYLSKSFHHPLQEDFATGVFPSEIVEQELPVPRVKTSKLERLPRAPEPAELQELLKQRPPGPL